MRRLSFVVSSALFLAGGLNLAFAQHSGGHAGSGHVAGGHASSGIHTHGAPASTTFSTLSNHYPSPGQLVYPTPLGLQRQYSGYTGINPGALSNGNNRRGNRGYGYGGAYLLPPFYYSTFDDSDTPYVYNSSAQDPAAQTAGVTANLLGEQIAQLSAEVDALRNERAASSYEPPMRPPYNAPPTMQDDQMPPSPPVTLILNNGKKLEVKNYAVMGDGIWDFSAQPAKRIPLSSINVGASKAATEANGAEFPSLP